MFSLNFYKIPTYKWIQNLRRQALYIIKSCLNFSSTSATLREMPGHIYAEVQNFELYTYTYVNVVHSHIYLNRAEVYLKAYTNI